MLGNYLLTWYLFLGGAGAGLYVVAYACVLLNCVRAWSLSRVVLSKVWPRSLVVSGFALAMGAVCLLKDLSRSDQAFYLFVKPSFSAISLGAYSLAVLLFCIVVLLALTFRRHDAFHLKVILLIGAVAALFSIVVILYTGFLLQSIAAVPFWRSPIVVPLFAASSLSSGLGCFSLVCATVFGRKIVCLKGCETAVNADTVVVVIEALLIVAYAVHLASIYGFGVFAGFAPGGICFWAFWLGVVAMGILVPLALQWISCRPVGKRYGLFITSACCSVAGAFFLRYCFIFGAFHISSIILLGV